MTEKEMSKTTEEEEIKENPQPKKSLWGGIGSFLSSVKEKTLKLVDDLQDQITALDESIGKSEEKEQKLTFDPSLLPIIESATTYLEEPTNPEFKTFSESFNIE